MIVEILYGLIGWNNINIHVRIHFPVYVARIVEAVSLTCLTLFLFYDLMLVVPVEIITASIYAGMLAKAPGIDP